MNWYINLDNLTANSDETTKQIFDFCRLEWSKETLDFHLRKDLFSKTLSSTQIRRKISPKNQSIYKNYYCSTVRCSAKCMLHCGGGSLSLRLTVGTTYKVDGVAHDSHPLE